MLRGAADAFSPWRAQIGSPEQLVRVDRAVLTEGPAAGSPVLSVRNPGGISFEVLLDRALDVGWADACGIPLAWSAPRGRIASVRHEPADDGWVRTFGGGLLTTCGLASTGAASVSDGVAHGLHGRIGHMPAENVSWVLRGRGGEAFIEISGDIVEAALGQSPLRLHRVIRAWVNRAVLEVVDSVTNDGFSPAGHMFRHHLNLGYPLVSDTAEIETDAVVVGTRAGVGSPPLDSFPLALAPHPVAEEVVYALTGPSNRLSVVSPESERALEIEWSGDTFPMLLVWRDPSPGVNVLGVEPSTSRDGGRLEADRDGELLTLAPGASRRYITRITVSAGPAERKEAIR